MSDVSLYHLRSSSSLADSAGATQGLYLLGTCTRCSRSISIDASARHRGCCVQHSCLRQRDTPVHLKAYPLWYWFRRTFAVCSSLTVHTPFPVVTLALGLEEKHENSSSFGMLAPRNLNLEPSAQKIGGIKKDVSNRHRRLEACFANSYPLV